MSVQLLNHQVPAIKRTRDAFGGMEMVQAQIDVTKHLYMIKGPSGNEPAEFGIDAAGYARANQVANVSFTRVDVLKDTRDVVTVQVSGVYYNASGERVEDTEAVTLDFPILHEAMRMKAKDNKGKWIWTGSGNQRTKQFFPYQEPKFEVTFEGGKPVPKLTLDPAIEMEVYQKILHLREMGIKKAITVAKNRLIKRAIGIYKVLVEPDKMKKVKDGDFDKWTLNANVDIPVVGYRAPATSKDVQAAIKQLFGGKAEPVNITPAMSEDDQHDVLNEDTSFDSDLPEIFQEGQAPNQETGAPASEENYVSCQGDDCARMIEPSQQFTVEQIVSYSKTNFNGLVLCLDCQKKYRAVKASRRGAVR